MIKQNNKFTNHSLVRDPRGRGGQILIEYSTLLSQLNYRRIK